MNAGELSVKAIFDEAAEIVDDGARRDYLERACAGDDAVRLKVDALLRAYADAGSFLQQPAADAELTDAFTPADSPRTPAEARPIGEGPGTRIGPYKLLQPIGEGGMGVVYMAEQEQPVRRRVALKIIKPGMDSRQVIARFEAERQALALMDHQNIARVLDAGTTETGRPYFVMELVHGVPITKYCDDTQFTPRERLELFVPVCRAIQHAHQKGIIHRDIKPSNVLVTMYDGKPVAKVIDFGVAKAIDQRLTERTMFTQYGSIIGTLEYMSPEQAEMSALGVDTRSDVYALGVLLYELLTGTTPLERMSLREAGYAEILRRIKEEEPPRPSTRLSASRAALPSISAQRKTEPEKLTRLMRGELDWIAMKCLEKDRTRRYETAIGLAQDVERYLNDEPVEACPPSASYRLRKFARKHRAPIAVAASFLFLLVAAVIVSAWQARAARRAEGRAMAERERALAAELEATSQRDLATDGRRESEASREALRRSLYASDIQLAQAAWKSGSILRMRELLDGHKPRGGEDDLRGFEWHYLRRLGSAFRSFQPMREAVGGVLSPDGRRYARAVRVRARGAAIGQEFQVRLWDTTSGQELRGFTPFPGEMAVIIIGGGTFSRDGKRFAFQALLRDAAGREHRRYTVWEWDSGRVLFAPADPADAIVGGTFDPAGQRLAAAVLRPGDKGECELKVWEVEGGKELFTIPLTVMSSLAYRGLAFNPDGTCIAALAQGAGAGNDKEGTDVRVWDVTSGRERLRFPISATNVLAYSPDGHRLAVGAGWVGSAPAKAPIRIHDAGSGRELLQLTWEDEAGDPRDLGVVGRIAFSPDGSRLAAAARDGRLWVWDLTAVEPGGHRPPARVLEERRIPLSDVAWGADGGSVSTCDIGGTIQTWELAAREDRLVQRGPCYESFPPSCSEDASRFCAAFSTPAGIELKVWDRTGKVRFTAKDEAFEIRPGFVYVRRLKLSRDGDRLAFTSAGPGAIRAWDVATGRVLLRRDGKQERVWFSGAAFAPDGRRLAAISTGPRDSAGTLTSRVLVWDLESGKEERRLDIPWAGSDSGLAFSPDGTRLAGAVGWPTDESPTVKVRVWDAATGAVIMAREFPFASRAMPAFSADGSLLAVAVGEWWGSSEVKVLDISSGKELRSFAGHRNQVHGLVFSPDGQRLASSSAPLSLPSTGRTPRSSSGTSPAAANC